MQIAAYQSQLERFDEDLNREFYLHYSGQKEQLEVDGLYRENSDLFSSEIIDELEGEIHRASEHFSSKIKTLRKLWAFAVERRLEQSCNELTEEIASFESSHTVQWRERSLTYNQITLQLGRERDPADRRRLNTLRLDSLARSGRSRLGRLAAMQEEAINLGFENYFDCCAKTSGVALRELALRLEPLIASTESAYMERMDSDWGQTLGLTLSESENCDVYYWSRLEEFDRFFLSERMVPVLEDTLLGLGIDPKKQEMVELDLISRPTKDPRAFCAPIRVPQEIKIVLQPRGGQDDYGALLHESGHAQHFAGTSAALPIEHRICGDRGLSEVYAFLFEHLLLNEDWLEHTIGMPDVRAFLRFQHLHRAFLVRRYCGKLRYEISLHSEQPLADAGAVYAQELRAATGITYAPELCLEDLDDGFYAAGYLRAWIFEAQLREHLKTRYGRKWFRSRSTGKFLLEIWETGQLYSIEELCREIGIGELDPQPLADEILEGLDR